jgi:hypothetical protein
MIKKGGNFKVTGNKTNTKWTNITIIWFTGVKKKKRGRLFKILEFKITYM